MYDMNTNTLSFRLSKKLFAVLFMAIVPLSMMAQWGTVRGEKPAEKKISSRPAVSSTI